MHQMQWGPKLSSIPPIAYRQSFFMRRTQREVPNLFSRSTNDLHFSHITGFSGGLFKHFFPSFFLGGTSSPLLSALFVLSVSVFVESMTPNRIEMGNGGQLLFGTSPGRARCHLKEQRWAQQIAKLTSSLEWDQPGWDRPGSIVHLESSIQKKGHW